MRRPLFSACLGMIISVIGCRACEEAPTPGPPPGPTISAAEVLASHRVSWDAAERAQVIAEGKAALRRHDCNRCHTIDDVEPSSRPTHCVSCHHWLKGLTPSDRVWTKLTGRYGEDVIRRYQRNIVHYQRVPDLTKVGQRLRPDWISGYIDEPWDLRPVMDETMVRTRLSEEDRRAIVRYFAAVAEVADPTAEGYEAPASPEAPGAERIAEGRRLFLERGCNVCHTLGNIDTGKSAEQLTAVGMPAKLAPNLRFTRDRVLPDVLLAWILDPRAFNPDTLMPDMQLRQDEAEAIRDFILYADPELGEPPEPPSLDLPAALDRPVSWAEVKEVLLGDICVHCHMNDHEQDPGPGNVGGYGWPGTQLRMRTYEYLLSGAAVPGEDHYSVLIPRPGETAPSILTAMMRRRTEELRDRVAPFSDYERPHYPDEPPGMPMGLPSISDEKVALLRAWIEQGCVGPPEITGMPGIYDGFLVPDGPIDRQRGCELRAIPDERPSWAIQPAPEWHEGPREGTLEHRVLSGS